MASVDLKLLSHYACEDADCTLQLYEKFLPLIQREELLNLYEHIECPLVPVLAQMERKGVYIDPGQLALYSNELGDSLTRLEKEIHERAGREFNISSPKQLGEILFEEMKIHEQLGIKKIKKTKSGYSTDVSVLEKLTEHPIAHALLEYRAASKLKGTYVDTLPLLIHPQTQRLHAHFHQTGTSTGRLSSSDPNLQNIPIRSEKGKKIRSAFKAQFPNKNGIVSADYSQIELRLLAHVTQDESLLQAFRENRDIHRETAIKMFGSSQVTSEQRNQAKTINFGIIYGMGPQRLARENHISFKDAQLFIQKYFEQFPKIADYIQNSKERAFEEGCTRTLLGRKRPLPEIQSDDNFIRSSAENIAVNAPLQGSAADLIKLAMIQLHNSQEARDHKMDLLIQVHDELVFEVDRERSSEICLFIKKTMENAMEAHLPLAVPLKVEVGQGVDWLEAHS